VHYAASEHVRPVHIPVNFNDEPCGDTTRSDLTSSITNDKWGGLAWLSMVSVYMALRCSGFLQCTSLSVARLASHAHDLWKKGWSMAMMIVTRVVFRDSSPAQAC